MFDRGWLLATTSLGVLALAPPMAGAADAPLFKSSLPAVSTVNGELGAFAVAFGNDFGYGVTGSLSLPLVQGWGLQVDGLFGSAKSADFYGVGGHLFWRDPAQGLFGAYASYVGWNTVATVPVAIPIGGIADISGAKVGKIGAEGEAYVGRITLSGLLAYQYGTFTGVTGRMSVGFYATDNLRLDLSARYLQGLGGVGSVGAEWRPTAAPVSLFAESGFGANGYSYALGGAKLTFGGAGKTLIRHDREDDPESTLPQDLFTAIGLAYCPVNTVNVNGFCDGNV